MYRFICGIQVRPIGAEGVYQDMEFPIAMPTETATRRELFAKWQQLLGDELQPYVMTRVNGEFIQGFDPEHRFYGTEV